MVITLIRRYYFVFIFIILSMLERYSLLYIMLQNIYYLGMQYTTYI
jgi:hypothetical protein